LQGAVVQVALVVAALVALFLRLTNQCFPQPHTTLLSALVAPLLEQMLPPTLGQIAPLLVKLLLAVAVALAQLQTEMVYLVVLAVALGLSELVEPERLDRVTMVEIRL